MAVKRKRYYPKGVKKIGFRHKRLPHRDLDLPAPLTERELLSLIKKDVK